MKSRQKGKELKTHKFLRIGYKFLSLINNIGIIYWFLVIFILFLIQNLFLFCFKEQVKKLSRKSKILKYINRQKHLLQSLYNYLAVNQIISIMSLTLYLWYEYYENSCFELICLISDAQISGTKMVKLDIVVTIILILIFSYHFWRILILVKWLGWFRFKEKLDQSRVSYVREHGRLMRSGFGKGYDFEMNRRRL